jgi:hypothetical protein
MSELDRRPCGPLLFKLLMQKALIDTRATASLLRENLSSLDIYMHVDSQEQHRRLQQIRQGSRRMLR